jgi:hypothetical protein
VSAAALASATAPIGQGAKSGSRPRHGASTPGALNGGGENASNANASGGSVSPLVTLVRALTGSSQSGVGVLLPAILVVLALGGGVLALRRRRAA